MGSVLSWPPHDPVDVTDQTAYSFLGWSTDPNSSTLYDFTTPVTGPLDLYAVWGSAYSIPVKLVDTSNYPDIIYAPWTADTDDDGKGDGDGVIPLTAEPQTPRNLALAADFTQAAQARDSRYGCAFATVEKTSRDIQHIEENPIEYIYYSPRDGKVHLVYGAQYNAVNGTTGERDVVLDTNDETLYILFYKIKIPQIKYMLMEISGFLSEITNMKSDIPRSVNDLHIGSVAPNDVLTVSSTHNPMDWLALGKTVANVIRDERTGYALLMAVGMMLPAVMPRRRRRRKEE